MKKYLHLFLFALLSISAQAQLTPAITLTAEVDGNQREFTFAVADTPHTLQIDWGDGTLVETEEIPVNSDGWTYQSVYGTPVGNGEIKIYGDGITLFYCSSRVDGAQITALDVSGAPMLDELVCNTNSITTLDLSSNTALTDLTCSNNPIAVLDLKANTALTSIEATNMQLESIDLTNCTALTTLRLNDNRLTDIDLSANTELASLYLLDNQITDIDLSKNTKLTYVSLNNNLLTSVDVTACENLGSFFCMNNLLTEANFENVTKSVNIRGNNFTLATLPVANSTSYFYDQQKPMQIAETIGVGETIDLSEQNNITGLEDGPQATTYTWITVKGDTLKAGSDYTEEAGKFTFLAEQDSIYCAMETKAFPSFTGVNAFKTTTVTVTDGTAVPTPAITLTAEVDGNQREFTFAVADTPHTLQIDWGDGTLVETEEIPVNSDGWTYQSVYGTPVGNGEIKIYGDGITLFYCSSRVDGAQITALDVSGAPMLDELVCNTNSITTLDLSSNTALTDLTCSNNPIAVLDLKANTALTSIEATNMQLESIDLTNCTALTTLRLNDNRLTDIDLSANTELASLYLLDNQITDIDLSKNTKLTYVSLNNNLLTSVDVTACENLGSFFCMNNLLTEANFENVTKSVNIRGNNFTLATLPVANSTSYFYDQQKPMQIAETIGVGETIDLSEQNNITGLEDGPQATTYTWITVKGDTLKAGSDYTEEAGKFTFLAEQDSIYCAMETKAFPSFTGVNAFKTTTVEVTGGESISSASAGEPVIRGGKGLIEAYNLPEGSTIEVYDLSGRKVAVQDVTGNRTTFNVKPGLYIVSVNGMARKVSAM